MSKRGEDWIDFQYKVLNHIDNYAVPQYGDKGNDIASEYSAKECNDAIKKYSARFGKNSRSGQQALDFLKMTHYAQMGYDALMKEVEENSCRICGNLKPCHCNDMEGLG